MQRVLITGGAGFIGSALARRLVEMDAEVLVIDSMEPRYGGNFHNLRDLSGKIFFEVADVRDVDAIARLVQGVDVVFNLAGQTSHLDSMHDPFTDLDINSRAQLSILEALRHGNPEAKVVFASTRQIYGRPRYLPVDELHPVHPVDVNGINKLSGEWYHRLYNDIYGIRGCALRLTNTYGPGMRIKDARQTFVGVWLRQLLQGETFEVWGGDQLRDFNYVDDVVDAFLVAARSESMYGGVFNLGSHEVVSLRQLAELLVELNGSGQYQLKEFPPERRKIDIGDYFSDYGAIKSTVGWEPKVSLREGLVRTLNFLRTNLEHYL